MARVSHRWQFGHPSTSDLDQGEIYRPDCIDRRQKLHSGGRCFAGATNWLSYRERRDFWAFQNARCPLLALRRHSGGAVYQGLGAAGVATPPWTRQRVPASAAVVSMTSKSWVIVAVLAIIADAEQYFSTESLMARSTFSGASLRPFTAKRM